MARLPDYSSIFSAELTALYIAVTCASSLPGELVIFTDSLSSIMALKSLNTSVNYMVHKITNQLVMSPKNKITIEWVPSHVNILGNDEADKLAKKATTLPQATFTNIALDDFSRKCKWYYSKMWHDMWDNTRLPVHYMKFPLGYNYRTTLTRKEQVCLTRLRLGTCMLTHAHHFQGTDREICQQCQCIMTLKHLLIDCPLFITQRVILEETCIVDKQPFTVETILGREFPGQAVIKYLKDISYYSKI